MSCRIHPPTNNPPLKIGLNGRSGSDITIITLGPALYTAVAAADELKSRYNLSAEVIDLRAANPLNYDPLAESVRKTGKVLLASDAVERGSVMHTA